MNLIEQATNGIVRQVSPNRRPQVMIGSGPLIGPKDYGEVWTYKRKTLRRIQKALTDDWYEAYPSKANGMNDRFFLTRIRGERVILERFEDPGDNGPPFSMPGLGTYSHPSVPGERIFNQLITDKVLVHPPAKLVRGLHLYRADQDTLGAVVNRKRVWQVNTLNLDAWIGARLLCLPNMWP